MASLGGNVQVVCRFRPLNSRENREGGHEIISYDDSGEGGIVFD